MADGSDTTLAVIAETVAGFTPATPAFANLRITNETLSAAFETVVSESINTNADVPDVKRVGLSVTGDVAFELHRDTGLDTLIAAALRGSWVTNTLKAAKVKPSFTLERKIVGSATSYFRFTGCRIGGFSLSFTPDQIVTGSFSITGTGHALPTNAILTGATYSGPASDATAPVMAGVDVSSFALSGITGVDYSSFTIEVQNALRVNKKLTGGTASRGIGFGRRQVTGTIVCYFEDLAAYTAFINNSTPSVTATVSDGTNSYTITLPRIRITGGEVPVPGNDEDIMLTLNYQALYDTTLGTSLQVVRV